MSSLSSSSSSSPFSTRSKGRSILCEDTALLHQYQEEDDDDLTSNLLHAIRSWNLERPSNDENDNDENENSKMMMMYAGGDACSSTIATDGDDNTDATNNNTTTNNTNYKSALPPPPTTSSLKTPTRSNGNFKTPCRGNYSARPSFLTTRIMEQMKPRQVQFHIDDGDGNNDGDDIDANLNGASPLHAQTIEDSFSKSDPKHQIKSSPSTNNTPSQTSQNDNDNDNDDNDRHHRHEEHEEAIRILRETATALGLHRDDVHSIVPMISKLVKVVKFHVPRLERFVDDVCDIVSSAHSNTITNNNTININNNSNSNGDNGKKVDGTGECKENSKGNPPPTKKSKPKKGGGNMKARRNKMTETVSVLRKELSKTADDNDDGISTKKVVTTSPKRSGGGVGPSRQALRPVDENKLHNGTKGDFAIKDKETTISSLTTSGASLTALPSSELILFHKNVINLLVKRQHRIRKQEEGDILPNMDHDDDDDPETTSETTHTPETTMTHEEALRTIHNLLNYETTSHRIRNAERIATSFATTASAPPSGPNDGETFMKELIRADPPSLRKFVLHFGYLFSVGREEMIGKMNDLYHFTQEAGDFIDCVRKCVCRGGGGGKDLSLNAVGRRVIEIVGLRSFGVDSLGEDVYLEKMAVGGVGGVGVGDDSRMMLA